MDVYDFIYYFVGVVVLWGVARVFGEGFYRETELTSFASALKKYAIANLIGIIPGYILAWPTLILISGLLRGTGMIKPVTDLSENTALVFALAIFLVNCSAYLFVNRKSKNRFFCEES